MINLEMKKIKTIILVAFVLLSILKVKAQIIPNGSFENWTLVGSINTPDNWQGSVLQPCSPISPVQTTETVDGNYAILFETITCDAGLGVNGGNAAVLFSLSGNPQYLNGYYKSTRTGTGAAEIRITLKNNSTIIGTGQLQINSNTSTYTPFSLPITYTSELMADEAGIWLSSDVLSNKVLGNRLWVDKLTFSSTPLSTNDHLNGVESISIYPNPANDILNLELKNEGIFSIRIINTLGQELSKHKVYSGINTINTELLESGIYFIEASMNGKKVMLKFIKE
jgi:hypothetical protein